jgi:hypothetical protein
MAPNNLSYIIIALHHLVHGDEGEEERGELDEDLL